MDGLHAINTETPKFGAITHSTPALRQLFIDVIDRYGITTEEKLWSVPAGDALPYVQAGYRVLQLIDVELVPQYGRRTAGDLQTRPGTGDQCVPRTFAEGRRDAELGTPTRPRRWQPLSRPLRLPTKIHPGLGMGALSWGRITKRWLMRERRLSRSGMQQIILPPWLRSLAMGMAACFVCLNALAQAPAHVEGTLANGASYLFDVPARWNGTVLLFSRGYSPGPKLIAANSMGPNSKQWLLLKGYALVGSSFSKGGWSVEEAIPDNLATLDVFAHQFGKPKRTIAWGASMGALITVAMIERYPDRFDAALPMCGSLAGAVGMLNVGLDGAFAIKTLLAPPNADLPLTGASDDMAIVKQAMAIVTDAQKSPAGRARLALAATLAQVPAWANDKLPEPAPADFEAQQLSQAATVAMSTFYPRADQEQRAGGAFSWNTAVDYRAQLDRSQRRDYVAALYKTAGVELDADLAKLNAAPRVSADSHAVDYMMQNYVPSGDLVRPVLALHTTGDGMTTPNMESAYRDYVHTAGKDAFLRTVFTRRAGHCSFTAAEEIAALQALEERVGSGKWNAKPEALNRRATTLGLDGQLDHAEPSGSSNTASPEKPAAVFVAFEPAAFLRPCGSGKNACEGRPIR